MDQYEEAKSVRNDNYYNYLIYSQVASEGVLTLRNSFDRPKDNLSLIKVSMTILKVV